MWEDESNSERRDDLTRLLRRSESGQPADVAELLPLVYEQLRAIACARMAGERRDHTLQATALVHEAYLRLFKNDGDGALWSSRAHFFAAAAEAMRRILIEHARSRGRVKRGGDGRGRAARRQPINLLDLASENDPDEILMLDEAIQRLEREDPDAAQVVRLRFFAGLSIDDTARVLGVSPSTVDREWAYARAKLHRMMGGSR
jgi:RNA polymerase sigma factor (TIGR02999 family)